ncbi:MAG: hypothetical protein ACKOAX_09435 [Candidatus Kapaibacterium sp.]
MGRGFDTPWVDGGESPRRLFHEGPGPPVPAQTIMTVRYRRERRFP